MALDISPVEWFGKNVRRHLLGWTEVDFDLLLFYLLPDPMHLDINMFHFAMVFRIPKNFECRLVVNPQWRWPLDLETKFSQ